MNNSVGNTARLIGAGLRALLVLTVVCGVIYPLAVTGIAQAAFNNKANGSEIKDKDGQVVGSSLIGQTYNLPKKTASDSTTGNDAEEAVKPDLKWFQPRPSNGLGSNSVNTQYSLILSGATNRSADNGAVNGKCTDQAEEGTLCAQVIAAKDAVIADNSTAGYTVKPEDVPADAVTSSGSGLDPDISPEYAELQVHRVAEQNKLDVEQVEKLVADHTTGRVLGFMGEPRVNVLELNIALRALTKS
ncbi:potassium-transporting ATPase subunit C [Streptomyces sp. AP-93]|uniref:potassium-transporting ATPase subunit C n=1 Tax=Streptomyces sp. AP-93 TaxID=2929048 RepID=UPI001FAFF2D6|nr:potassium-transporting ATPase subunit C [Streptomyces sp. AP-93]MCJ0869628.1 potassium-transporting ATPase subunit C [Streptomyces sp. AP-93]